MIVEIRKTDKIRLTLKEYAITTPNKAEWARVSPKYDNLLQTIKHPNGPVINANPIPATNALNKKSSNINIFNGNDQRYHLVDAHDHVHVGIKQE